MHRPYIALFVVFITLVLSLQAKAESPLPEIGGGGYGIISLQQEHRLGQAWARILRGSAKLHDDALVSQYIEDLTWSLVTHSELQDKRLEVIVLDNPTMNAFAAPGGIIGVHTGLLLTAENEAQLASVLAHELAHLSQRHFAAQLEEDRRNRPLFIASLLGSILLSAANTEAGVAGIQASIGASAANKLSFSRQNEREADYIGLQTLTRTGYAPQAMANMFMQLQKQARFSPVPPEFLLTHPVTQSRISDAQDRAASLKGDALKRDTVAFNIAKIRVQVHHSKDLKTLIKGLKKLRAKRNTDILRYALAYAAIKDGQLDLAKRNISSFSAAFSKEISSRFLKAELLLAEEQYPQAVSTLKNLLDIYPGHHAISYAYAEALLKTGQPAKASKIYQALVENNPKDSRAWYLLAESYGLEGNVTGVHEARIEYFLLTADVDSALKQVDYALKNKSLSDNDRARLEQHREEALRVRESLELNY